MKFEKKAQFSMQTAEAPIRLQIHTVLKKKRTLVVGVHNNSLSDVMLRLVQGIYM